MPGTLSFADWTVNWSIPTGWGGGLVISKARFRNDMVLYQGTMPFVLVPYHGGSPIFKDGLHHQGAAFLPVVPTAANAFQGPSTPPAGNDNQWDCLTNPTGAVMVEREPATLIEPATAVIWAKFQCVNYQYVHRWEFRADGSIEASVGLGGVLFTKVAQRSNHVHNFYLRLDFDIAGAANNAVQQFSHPNNNLGSDMWVLAYDPAQDGYAVGINDSVLHTTYLHGPGTVVNGADIVVWCSLRHHHETRQSGEETITLPYEFLSCHIEPRDFLDGTPTRLYPTTPPSP